MVIRRYMKGEDVAGDVIKLLMEKPMTIQELGDEVYKYWKTDKTYKYGRMLGVVCILIKKDLLVPMLKDGELKFRFNGKNEENKR